MLYYCSYYAIPICRGIVCCCKDPCLRKSELKCSYEEFCKNTTKKKNCLLVTFVTKFLFLSPSPKLCNLIARIFVGVPEEILYSNHCKCHVNVFYAFHPYEFCWCFVKMINRQRNIREN